MLSPRLTDPFPAAPTPNTKRCWTDDSDADSVAAAALDAAGSSALATLPPAASALPEELVVGEGMRGAQMLVRCAALAVRGGAG